MADFAFPDSVVAYLTDRGIGAAVDSLIGRTLERVPPVEWEELPDYYDATLATVQVQVDWARSAALLWDATWADLLAGWSPLDLSEQGKHGFGTNSVRECWDSDWFLRVWRRGVDHLFAYIHFSAAGCFVGVAASTLAGKAWTDHGLHHVDGWDPDDGILWSPDGAVAFRPVPDVAALRDQARRLLALADGVFAPH